jgi:ABC-type branched-subunit amino acid transport system substrate-binding protein
MAASKSGRWLATAAAGLILIAALAGCGAEPRQVAKIGLVAPFEGRYREIGSDVIPAVRLALQEWAAADSGRSVLIELVAYDDMGDPELAAEQAAKLAADPEVVVVIGHWRDITTSAALPIYGDAALPLITYSTDDVENPAGLLNLAPSQAMLTEAVDAWAESEAVSVVTLMNSQPTIQQDIDQLLAALAGVYETDTIPVGGPAWDIAQFPAMAPERAQGSILFASGLTAIVPNTFAADYKEHSLGVEPGPYALTAYQAGWLAIQMVLEQMGGEAGSDETANITFGEDGRRNDAPIYLYRWESGQRTLIETLRP